jgi:hypothetical protein
MKDNVQIALTQSYLTWWNRWVSILVPHACLESCKMANGIAWGVEDMVIYCCNCKDETPGC